jgi:hypothetical protein
VSDDADWYDVPNPHNRAEWDAWVRQFPAGEPARAPEPSKAVTVAPAPPKPAGIDRAALDARLRLERRGIGAALAEMFRKERDAFVAQVDKAMDRIKHLAAETDQLRSESDAQGRVVDRLSNELDTLKRASALEKRLAEARTIRRVDELESENTILKAIGRRPVAEGEGDLPAWKDWRGDAN